MGNLWLRNLLPGARIVRDYGERLVKDISATQFARKPAIGGVIIDINHPAFTFGHLALYPSLIAQFLGLPIKGMEVPAKYPELFKQGVACHDDPEGTLYPAKDDLVYLYLSATDILLNQLSSIEEERLTRPLEDPKRQERFGSVGGFMTYALLPHSQGHFGQVSAWRRCMGLGAV